MFDEVLTAAFRRLDCNPYLLAEYLGNDWYVEGELITDNLPGGMYRVQGTEIYLVRTVCYKEDWKKCTL